MYRITRSATNVARRHMGTAAPKGAIPPHLQYGKKPYNFKKEWLSDESTYPLILVIGCGLTFMCGMAVNGFATYKDLRFTGNSRNSIVQYWGGEGHTTKMTERVAHATNYGLTGAHREEWEDPKSHQKK